MRRITLISVLIFLFSLTRADSVFACGGGAPFYIQDLDSMDTIVHATVVATDDRGYNSIFQVDQYYKGSGGDYLAIERYSSALETVATVRNYNMACTYSGGGAVMEVGVTGYFGLTYNGDGTYSDSIGLYRGMPHFYPVDGEIEYLSYDPFTDIEAVPYTVTVEEFEALLLEKGGRRAPVAPDQVRYPLMRYLEITTESGARYRLNPDRSLTTLGPENTPLAISNDGSHVMFRLDENRLGFQYLMLTKLPEEPQIGGSRIYPQPGLSARFSPDSNFVAVQEESHFVIYMFDNYEDVGYGQGMGMEIIATSEVNWASDAPPPIVWSADSTTVAYQSEGVIWRWDIFADAEPQQVVSPEDDTILLDLSSSGRYVRYGQTETWSLYDTRTGDTYQNAIATPDERNLIYIQPEFPEGTPDINREVNVGEPRTCEVPLAQSCPIYIERLMADWYWYKNNQIAVLSCAEEYCFVESFSWQLAISSDTSLDGRILANLPRVSALAYDPWYDRHVLAVEGGYTLEFEIYPLWNRDEPSDPPLDIDSLDLSDQLDSPITELKWGLPLFYEVRNQW